MRNIVIILHYDWDEYIHNNLPIASITEWADANGYEIIEVFHDHPCTAFNSVIDTDVCAWSEKWFDNTEWASKLFHGDNIILTGGYRSQCLKWVYSNLVGDNNVYINPSWVVSEPSYINWIYPWFKLWDYPESAILKAAV